MNSKHLVLTALSLATLAPVSAQAQHSSKNVTQAASNYVHRKTYRATRGIAFQHRVFKRYTHRKRAHIKHYLDTH